MAHHVMLTVQAEVDDNDAIIAVAKEYPRWEDIPEEERYADETPNVEFFCFVQDVAAGKVFFSGNKGGDALLWGGVYNYANGEDFADHLGSFMVKCPEQWISNVIVTWENEQSAARHGKLLWSTKRIGFDPDEGCPTDERRVFSVDIPADFYAWHIGDPNGPPRCDARTGWPCSRIIYVSWEKGHHEVATCPHCRRLTEFTIEPETVEPKVECVNCKRPLVLRTVWRHR